MEAEAVESSDLVGTPLREAKLPQGLIIGALVRDGEVIMPRGDTVVRAHDRVVLFAQTDVIKQVERMFAVSLEFF